MKVESAELGFLKFLGSALLALAAGCLLFVVHDPIQKLKEFWDFWRGK